jgi:hypothetical protein
VEVLVTPVLVRAPNAVLDGWPSGRTRTGGARLFYRGEEYSESGNNVLAAFAARRSGARALRPDERIALGHDRPEERESAYDGEEEPSVHSN